MVGGRPHCARISELIMYAMEELKLRGVRSEALIRDRKKMVRGSYFAVHAGKRVDDEGQSHERFGEEDILVLRKG